MTDAVLVWREQVLPGSETFIRNHVRGLRGFTGVLAGTMRVISALAEPDDVIVYSRSLFDRISLFIAAKTGVSPRLIRQLWLAKQGRGPLAPQGAPVRLVHAHFANDAWFIALATKLTGLPLVVTCHGYDVTEKPSQPGLSGLFYRVRTKFVFAMADEVIAVSDFIADRVKALGCAAPVVRYNGIEVGGSDVTDDEVLQGGVEKRAGMPTASSHSFETVSNKTSDNSEADVIFVGRLVGKKGVVDLLEAAHTVALQRGELTVRIVGDGPLRESLETRAQELSRTAEQAGAQLSISFEGSRNPATVARLLRSAKVFVGPSTTADNGDCEGFGQVFLEAALAGLPCVSRFHGGIPEAIDHGTTGFLSAEGDNDALAAHIATLLADDELRQRMGRAGRRRVLENFALPDCLAKIEQDYRDLLGRN